VRLLLAASAAAVRLFVCVWAALLKADQIRGERRSEGGSRDSATVSGLLLKQFGWASQGQRQVNGARKIDTTKDTQMMAQCHRWQ